MENLFQKLKFKRRLKRFNKMSIKPITKEKFIKLGFDKTCSYEHYIWLFNEKSYGKS